MTKESSRTTEAILLSNLVKSFGSFVAVNNVNIAVPQGAFLVLVGPSGCGKSTLLRMLAGLETPTEGEIAFMGRTVSDGKRGLVKDAGARDAGLVFQSYALWPHMTVAGNIEWPLKVGKWSKADRLRRIDEVLSLLGISELRDRYPSEISGGQQQRVAIARTIAPRPSILLFDEPLSNLDAKLRVEMRSELMRVHRATGATSVYVTHDQVEAMTMASHVAVLDKGRVEQFGTPMDLLENPKTAFVATFLGTPPANLLPVKRSGSALAFHDVPLASMKGSQDIAEAQLLYRAQDILVGNVPGKPVITATFEEAAPIAGRTMVTASCAGQRITAMADGHYRALPGETISLSILQEPNAIFAVTGERVFG